MKRQRAPFCKIQKYSDLLAGRFQIDELIRVNRINDEHTISNKIFDFYKKDNRIIASSRLWQRNLELKG